MSSAAMGNGRVRVTATKSLAAVATMEEDGRNRYPVTGLPAISPEVPGHRDEREGRNLAR